MLSNGVFNSKLNRPSSKENENVSEDIFVFEFSEEHPNNKQSNVILDSDENSEKLHIDPSVDISKNAQSLDNLDSVQNKNTSDSKNSNFDIDSEPKQIVLNTKESEDVLDIKNNNDTLNSDQNKNVSDFGHSNNVLNSEKSNYIISDDQKDDVLDAKVSDKLLNTKSSKIISNTKLDENDLISYQSIDHLDAEQIKIIYNYVQSGDILKLGITEWCELYSYPD